ncbi:LAETG motif-containing sortase-dependent surface protein [Streptomyces sp. NPDC058284]|uniref:LAETG motif-containing sortase-dependent surface protein n=1 Tax=unclassified Streptomyces TaxID=2593676 RepID=UPI0036579222
MSARRSLLTTAAAGAVLGALCFVPSANATSPTSHDAPRDTRPATSAATSSATSTAPHHEATAASAPRLAETGGFDTTPYVVGGTAFLGLGAAFVVFSVRRERAEGEAAY